MPKSTRWYWPACTIPACGHRRHAEDEVVLTETIHEHPDWVASNGSAVCACHGPDVASSRGVDRFPCNGDALGRFR